MLVCQTCNILGYLLYTILYAFPVDMVYWGMIISRVLIGASLGEINTIILDYINIYTMILNLDYICSMIYLLSIIYLLFRRWTGIW